MKAHTINLKRSSQRREYVNNLFIQVSFIKNNYIDDNTSATISSNYNLHAIVGTFMTR